VASTQRAIDFKAFKGLNLREDPSVIGDADMSSCLNFNIGRSGELTKRTGFELLNPTPLGALPIKLIGYYYTSTYSQILARIGANLYYSVDGINWVLIGAYAVEHGIQYNDKFYMVRKGTTMLEWTGTGTPSAVSGSPSGDFCLIHKERIFIFDSGAAGTLNSRIYFSNVLSATDWGAGSGSIDIGVGDGDFLVGAAVVHDLLVVFKSKSTWGLYVQGTGKTDWVVRSLNDAIGCVSKYSIRVIENLVYFVGADGIFRSDGTSLKSISDDIQPVLKNRVVNLTNANIDAAFYWNDMYVVLVQPTPNVVRYFAYHVRANGWTEWVVTGGYRPSYFIEISGVSPSAGVYAGDMNSSGNAFRFGQNIYTDVGFPYASSFSTKDFDFGSRAVMKRGKWIAIDTIGQMTVTVNHDVNAVAGPSAIVTTSPLSQVQKVPGPGYFRTWKLSLSAAGVGPFTFFGMTAFLHSKHTQIGASV